MHSEPFERSDFVFNQLLILQSEYTKLNKFFTFGSAASHHIVGIFLTKRSLSANQQSGVETLQPEESKLLDVCSMSLGHLWGKISDI